MPRRSRGRDATRGAADAGAFRLRSAGPSAFCLLVGHGSRTADAPAPGRFPFDGAQRGGPFAPGAAPARRRRRPGVPGRPGANGPGRRGGPDRKGNKE